MFVTDAGLAFTEAARLHEERLDSRHEAANSYAEAAQVYKKVSAQGMRGGNKGPYFLLLNVLFVRIIF